MSRPKEEKTTTIIPVFEDHTTVFITLAVGGVGGVGGDRSCTT
jgi:hypothetical protein